MPYLRSPEYFLNRFHEKQEEAWLAYKSGLDLVLDFGRRAGKSELIAEIFIEDIEENGKDCLYIALTQQQAREIMWPKLVQRLSNLGDWKSNEARLEWRHLPSGATLSLKGGDLGKDRLRGSAKRLIALDEFAFFKDPTIVKDVLIPQLADYNGQMVYCSTPKGKNHFWKLKQLAKSKPNRFFTTHCTVFENPFISKEGREKLLREYDGIEDPLYRQEVLAEYVDFNGLVFALPQDSYIEKRWDKADLDHSFHWRGMDHGFSPDPTACVWIAYNERKGYFQVYSEYKQTKLLINQHADLIKNHEPFRIVDTICDIDPQLIAEYDAIGFKCIPAGKYDKESRILRVVNALRTGKLKISDSCTMLLDEMATYEWNDKDQDDHLVDSLNYGYTNLVIPRPVETKFDPIPNKLDIYDFDVGFHGQDFG